MKKIISLALVTVMLVFALASCDMINKLLGKEPEKTPVRTTITEEEWKALETTTNFTAEGTMSSTMSRGEESQTSNSKGLLKQSDTAVYDKTEYLYEDEEPSVDESYYVEKDGKSYYLVDMGSDLGWVAHEDNDIFNTMLDVACGGEEIEFKDLVYDEEKKAYVYTLDEEDIHGVISLYFEDGKLVKTVISATGDMGEGEDAIHAEASQTIVFSNIGTTTVDLPEYTIANEQ